MMLIKKNKKIFIYFIFFLLLGSLNNKYLNKINFPKLNQIQINGINEKNQVLLLFMILMVEEIMIMKPINPEGLLFMD